MATGQFCATFNGVEGTRRNKPKIIKSQAFDSLITVDLGFCNE